MNTFEVDSKETGSYYSQNSIFFKAKVLVPEIVPSEILEQYAWTWKGKELRWRHQVPEDNIDVLIGHVHDAEVVEGVLVLSAEVWGYDLRPELLEIHELVKDGTLSISGGFKTTTNEGGEVIAMYGRELSLTPIPACTVEMGCGITNISEELATLEEKSDQKIKELITMSENEAIKLLERQIASNEEKYSKLETSFKERNQKLLETNLELENTNEKLTDEVKKRNVTIAEQVQQLEDKDKKILALETEVNSQKTLSIREDIAKLEKYTDPKAFSERVEKLKGESLERLEDHKAGLERALKITKKVNQSKSNRPEISSELESNDDPLKNEQSPEDYAASMYPDLASMHKGK